MKKFNLMQILPSLESGGVEQGTIDLANFLASLEIKNHIVPSSKKQEVISFMDDFDNMSEYDRLNGLEPIEFELEIEGRK